MQRDIIVIGASAGGFEAIRRLVAGLPAGLPASVFIVWHMAPEIMGVLPQMLNKCNTLPAAHAVDTEPVRRGRIYVAPPDHHLLIDQESVRVTRGPKENRFLPAVDPLFRSAAYAYGPRVIGIILTGALDDGASGLWIIKRHGGLAMVQDPRDAEVSSMPENALQAVKADFKLTIAEMPEVLTQLVVESVQWHDHSTAEENNRLRTEIGIAMENEQFKNTFLSFGDLTPYTCPECHGVLTSIQEENRVRFRCHTGHAFSADSLLAGITENVEDNLWGAIRSVQESVMLLNHMGDHFASVNQPAIAAMYFNKAKEADLRASIVRKAVANHEQLSTIGIEHEATAKPTGEKTA